jgi:hypothetical protein
LSRCDHNHDKLLRHQGQKTPANAATATAPRIHTRKKAREPLPRAVARKIAKVAAAIDTVPQAMMRSLSFTLKIVRPPHPA